MELQTTDFLTVKDFPNYAITKCGKVWSKNYNKFMTIQVKNGYGKVNLRANGTTKQKFVHRLVALAYLSNTYNKKEVNHKDGNKLNNHVNNLEWSTPSENSKHAHNTGLSKNCVIESKKALSKVVLDTATGIFYDSAKELSRIAKINYGTLKNKLNGHDNNNTSFIYA
jgi:hypothetical protein